MEKETEETLKSVTRRIDETVLLMALSAVQEAWGQASEGSEIEAKLAKARNILTRETA